jgi:hypothetical protein
MITEEDVMGRSNPQQRRQAKAARRRTRLTKNPLPTGVQRAAAQFVRERLDAWRDTEGTPLPPPSQVCWLTGLDDYGAAYRRLVAAGLYEETGSGKVRVAPKLREVLTQRESMTAQEMRAVLGLEGSRP